MRAYEGVRKGLMGGLVYGKESDRKRLGVENILAEGRDQSFCMGSGHKLD